MAIWYIDPENGVDANTFADFAQRGRTLSALTVGKGLAVGDEIRVIGSADPVDSAILAAFANNNKTVTLASALTTNIYMTGAWTPSANVTATSNTTNMIEGTDCSSMAIAGAFTTGLVAYFPTGTLDLSTKQQISFSIRSNISTAANTFRVDLCTDTVGAVPVHSFTINRALSNTNRWTKFVFDNGSAMNSAIQSIAIVALLDPGTNTVLFDACWASTAPGTAGALTTRSLIGKNTAGDKNWWPIKAINGTTLTIDNDINLVANSANYTGYSGTTESAELWHRETIKTDIVTVNATVNQSQLDATYASPITISGGWNRTDMSTQTLETSWLDGLDGFGFGLVLNSDWWNASKIFGVRYGTAVALQARYINYTGDLKLTGCVGSVGALSITSGAIKVKVSVGNTVYLNSNTGTSTIAGNGMKFGNIEVRSQLLGSSNHSISYAGRDWNVGDMKFRTCNNDAAIRTNGCGSALINSMDYNATEFASTSTSLITCTAQGGTGPIRVNSVTATNIGWLFQGNGYAFLNNVTSVLNFGPFNSAQGSGVRSSITAYYTSMQADPTGARLGFPAYSGKSAQYVGGTSFSSDNTIVHSNSAESWVFQTSIGLSGNQSANIDFPMTSNEPYLVYVPANKTLTFTAYVRREFVAEMMIRLRVKGNSIAGVPNDVIANAASVTDNAWEQISLSVTPTISGLVEIWPEAYPLVATVSLPIPSGIRCWIDDLDWSIT